MSPLLAEAVKLSVPERIELVEAIWDTIAADPATLPLSEAHREELDRRLKDLADDPDAGSPWEEVRARLEQIP
ncbi:MAG TPA: addiction module protein [Thermoanaerobaculia bacterium]|jgi:putative addiction module component (TIGR02574 family)|nr:addiction module protein [Thermoanaerobaculia bacterium]